MPNPKMDTIQIQDAIVGEQRTFSPGFKLVSECLVEAADRAGAGGNSRQCFRDFPDFMSARATDKHLRECLRYLRFVAAIVLKNLNVKHAFSISWHREILNASCLGLQISWVRAIAI